MRWAPAMLCGLAWLCAGPACAQVFEVGAGGALHEVGNAAVTAAAPREGQATAASIPPAYRDAVLAAAQANGLSPWLVDAVARAESGYDPGAVSGAGAVGIMQLMPATARELGVDPRDPAQNIAGGARYLRRMLDRFGGDLQLALAAYDAGGDNVLRYGGVPPFRETRDYVQRNLDRLASAPAVVPAAALAEPAAALAEPAADATVPVVLSSPNGASP